MFNQKGFTLIELLSVMVIMSVMASVTIKKFDLVSDNAEIQALEAAKSELNARENLTWTNMKLSNAGWTNDLTVFTATDPVLGQGFDWDGVPTIAGGTLEYRQQSIILVRDESTSIKAGRWH